VVRLGIFILQSVRMRNCQNGCYFAGFFWILSQKVTSSRSELVEDVMQRYIHKFTLSLLMLHSSIHTYNHFFWYVQWWEWDFPCMRFSQRAIKDFLFFMYFFWVLFPSCHIKEGYAYIHRHFYRHIFIMNKEFSSGSEKEWRKKRKMTRVQRRGELFRISDHYGIKEDWGEFKGKLKGTFYKSLSKES